MTGECPVCKSKKIEWKTPKLTGGGEINIPCEINEEKITDKIKEVEERKGEVFGEFTMPDRKHPHPWDKYQLPPWFDTEEYEKRMAPVNEVMGYGDDNDNNWWYKKGGSWDGSGYSVAVEALVCLNCGSVSLTAPGYVDFGPHEQSVLSKIEIAMDALNEIGKLTDEIRNADAEKKKQAEIAELETKLEELKD